MSAEGLTARQLYSLPIVTGCALSPSKAHAAYVVSRLDEQANAYRGSVRIVRVADGRVQTVTHGTATDGAPQWSVDGAKLFFLSDRAGATQLWCVDVAGGEPVAMPKVPGNVCEFAVSPDGRRIVVVTTPTAMRDEIERRGWRRITRLRYRADGPGFLDDLPQLWLIDLTSQSAAQLTDGSGYPAAPAWDHSGQIIAFSAEHGADADTLWRRELWTVSVADGWQPRKILHFGTAVESPAWSLDGASLAFCGIAEPDGASGLRNLRLYTVDRDGANVRCWTSDEEWTCGNFVLTDVGGAGSVAPPVWISRSRIAVLGTSRGAARVFRVSDGSRALPLTPGKPSVTQFAMMDRETAIFCASDPVTAPELYVMQDGVRLRRVTSETAAWSTNLAVAAPRHLQVPGPGGEIDAWYLEGNARAPRPCVLQIHGGPHYSYGYAFVFEFLLLASAGFDVLYCNPRGSSGYGEGFAGALRGDWGTPAYDDCMSIVDHALSAFPLDPKRLGVAGGSYGGYLTAWAIGHTQRFAAAVAMRPATNLASLWGTSEVGRMLTEELGGRPADIPEVYQRCSPLTYADDIATPLLIIHSENDYRCPTEQSEQLFAALRQRGAVVEVLRILRADHNLSRNGPPQQRVVRLEAIVDWFKRFLN